MSAGELLGREVTRTGVRSDGAKCYDSLKQVLFAKTLLHDHDDGQAQVQAWT